MRSIVIALGFVVVGSLPARAQWVVYDAAVTTRNSVTAVIKEYLLNTQRQQHERIRRMAARLSLHTNLDKYAPADPPLWRASRPNTFLYAGAYDHALTAGDAAGTAYMALVHPVHAAQPRGRGWEPAVPRALTARLATIDVSDAASLAATDAIGQLRANGRDHEMPAITALEASVTDPSTTQSATAVLDKIGGAVLIGARQRQARVQLLAGVLEQLLVDSKRMRDSDTEAMNMLLVTLREARAVNHAFAAGTGDALRAWRQP